MDPAQQQTVLQFQDGKLAPEARSTTKQLPKWISLLDSCHGHPNSMEKRTEHASESLSRGLYGCVGKAEIIYHKPKVLLRAGQNIQDGLFRLEGSSS